MMFVLPDITDWRINPLAPDQSVFVRNERFHRVERCTPESKMAHAIAEAVNNQPVALATRCAVDVGHHVYRIEQMPNRIIAVRVIPGDVPTLEDLRIPKAYRDLLLEPELAKMGGLVLIGGAAGSGKSHTAAATTIDYLRNGVADYALTYENPIEFQMAGFHGNGYCDQNNIPEGNYAYALSHCLRCFPAKAKSVLFVGEILDSDAAVELCKVFMSGNLVFSTLHGDSIIGALQRFYSLSGADTSKAVRDVIASSLRLVVHQELVPTSEGRRVRMQALKVSVAAQQLMAQGMLQNLRDSISITQNTLLKGS